jgi:tight adherence protein B
MLLLYGMVFGAVVLVSLASYPPVMERLNAYIRRRVDEARTNLEDIFVNLSQGRLRELYTYTPIVAALLGWVATGIWMFAIVGAGIGIVGPRLWVQHMRRSHQKRFHAQLVDTLLLVSSCLRAGLSMLQSFAVVAEEMPLPINQEFGLVLKETRMGVGLDEAMLHFKQRSPSDDTHLFVTAVLVARETGGDITAIFTRLVDTLRERKKIRERIKTLTFMSKLQAIVMAMLPIAFIFVTYSVDQKHFQFFLNDGLGRVMLAGIVMAQLFGLYLFLRFGRSPL